MSPAQKITVLLADDEPHIRLLMRKVMTSMNAEVVAEAANGKEAVLLFRQHRPHLAFLDITMPVMDGKTALKTILDEFPGACIIMLTSLSAMETVKECLEAGAANYLRKDTPISDLKRYIKESWENFHAP